MSLSSRHSSVLKPFGKMVLVLVFLVEFTVSRVSGSLLSVLLIIWFVVGVFASWVAVLRALSGIDSSPRIVHNSIFLMCTGLISLK